MFSLGQQIGRHPGRVGAVVGNDHCLSRTGQPIQTNQPENLLFGQGDKQITGPHNFVNSRHCFCAKGQRPDGLDAANLIYLIKATEVSGG